jgi:hypothetical protein
VDFTPILIPERANRRFHRAGVVRIPIPLSNFVLNGGKASMPSTETDITYLQLDVRHPA